MRRGLSTILSAVSLVLCIGFAALWVRSITHNDFIGYSQHPYAYWITSELGYVELAYEHSHEPADSNAGWWCGDVLRSYRGHRAPGFLGLSFEADERFYYQNPPATSPASFRMAATVPHWFLCMVTGIPTAVWLRRRHLLRRRLRAGLCPTCGYDLRASRERCPECGQAISVKEPVA